MREQTSASRPRTTTPAEQLLAALRAFHTRVVHCTSTEVAAWRELAGPELRGLTDAELRYEVAWAWLRAWATGEENMEDADTRFAEVLPNQRALVEHLSVFPPSQTDDYRHDRVIVVEAWLGRR